MSLDTHSAPEACRTGPAGLAVLLAFLAAMLGAAACAPSGKTPAAASVTGSFPARFDIDAPPAVASDGALWYLRDKELVRLSAGGSTQTFPLAPSSLVAADRLAGFSVVPSTGGTVWFIAMFMSEKRGVEEFATYVGRTGPRGVITSRLLTPAHDSLVGAAGATDGALWAHELNMSGAQRTDDLVREDVDGRVARFPIFPVGIVAGSGGRVWVLGTARSGGGIFRAGPSGVQGPSLLPGSAGLAALVARNDGSAWLLASARTDDQCLVGSIGAGGDVYLDQSHPLIDNARRLQLYEGRYGCFDAYAGSDGSLWVAEQPQPRPHMSGYLPPPPWHVYRVRPDGQRQQWTLASGDFVETMAAVPPYGMLFLTGRHHRLGAITAGGNVIEGLVEVPAVAASPLDALLPRLLPAGGATAYLTSPGDSSIRIVTVR